jgi:hypothetical protein
MKDKERFKEYYSRVDGWVKDVQSEMALGNIKSEESLVQVIERVSAFIVKEEAFAFFNSHAPYEWQEYKDELKRFDHDLGAMVLHITNSVVSIDVFRNLQLTAGYEFLIGEGEKCSIQLSDRSRVVLKEHWKADAGGYDYLAPLEILPVKDQTLSIYKEDEDGDPVFVLSHPDPALIWISELVVPKPDKGIAEYEKLKSQTLKKNGCPENQLWLIEVQTVGEFALFYKDQTSDPVGFYNLHGFHYVVYYHQAGEVLAIAGFNSDKEFEKGCKDIAGFVK